MMIVIERTDGGVSIMVLNTGAKEADEIAKWSELHGTYKSHRIVRDEDIPKDRKYRDAWKSDFTLDAAKVKQIDDKVKKV